MLASRATLPQKQRQQPKVEIRRWKREEEETREGWESGPLGRTEDCESRMENAITILKNGPGFLRERTDDRF